MMDRKLIEETIKVVRENPDAQDADIQKKVEDIVGYTGIPFVYKYSIVILGILALTAAFAGVIVLIIDPTGASKIPEALVSIGSASVGALVGIFARTPNNDGK